MSVKENNIFKRGSRKLFFKTYISIAAVITVFAVVLGMLYMRMYDKKTVENYRDDLKMKASVIASTCSGYFSNYLSSLDSASGNEVQWVGKWTDYIKALYDEQVQVYPVMNENATRPLTAGFALSEQSATLSNQYRELANLAMVSQEPVASSYYDDEQGKNFVVASAKVVGLNGECAGVVLVSKPTAEQEGEIIQSAFVMIIYSSLVALLVSFALAIPFVNALTNPISQIRATALTLAGGDYSAKTGIDRNDEVGELAKSMDFLADKLSENEVERKNAEQMRLDFFANVSHELRTPITVVRAYTETLKDRVVTDPEKIDAIYQRINNESIAMERLVGDLLTLSKMQNPDFSIEKEPVNLQQVIGDLVRNAATMAEEKKIQIKYDICEDPCIMQGDYGRLRQMFLVIIDNAIKFSNEGGTVYIKLACDSKITASIRDEGVGISEEEIPYIFDKFYRSKLRQNAKGSGLGLAIAKYICLKHNGEIHIDSEKGKGTCFTFTFEPETKVRIKGTK